MKGKNNQYRDDSKLLTAIVYCSEKQVNGEQFLKYRNISDTDTAISTFLLFAAKFPSAEYVNFYRKKDRTFKQRIYLQ